MVAKHKITVRDEFKPPKSIAELEREQGLDGLRPDYVALATDVWRTKDDLRAFQRHIRAMRRASK